MRTPSTMMRASLRSLRGPAQSDPPAGGTRAARRAAVTTRHDERGERRNEPECSGRSAVPLVVGNQNAEWNSSTADGQRVEHVQVEAPTVGVVSRTIVQEYSTGDVHVANMRMSSTKFCASRNETFIAPNSRPRPVARSSTMTMAERIARRCRTNARHPPDEQADDEEDAQLGQEVHERDDDGGDRGRALAAGRSSSRGPVVDDRLRRVAEGLVEEVDDDDAREQVDRERLDATVQARGRRRSRRSRSTNCAAGLTYDQVHPSTEP